MAFTCAGRAGQLADIIGPTDEIFVAVRVERDRTGRRGPLVHLLAQCLEGEEGVVHGEQIGEASEPFGDALAGIARTVASILDQRLPFFASRADLSRQPR